MSQPRAIFRSGRCSASVFSNTKQNGNRVYEQVSISFQRRYRDRESGEWKTTSSLGVLDVPDALLVLQKAWEFSRLKENIE